MNSGAIVNRIGQMSALCSMNIILSWESAASPFCEAAVVFNQGSGVRVQGRERQSSFPLALGSEPSDLSRQRQPGAIIHPRSIDSRSLSVPQRLAATRTMAKTAWPRGGSPMTSSMPSWPVRRRRRQPGARHQCEPCTVQHQFHRDEHPHQRPAAGEAKTEGQQQQGGQMKQHQRAHALFLLSKPSTTAPAMAAKSTTEISSKPA
jgi:hypothetical protein